ncbi:MAG: response regulator, partial [Oligoflexales bacterium]|nr:response regulator [Oligoflexales bacterium]
MKTVAIVDDALLIRLQLKKFFEETMNFKVVAEGANGNEAIGIYEKYQPDMMTLDLTMPNMGGLKALAEVSIKKCRLGYDDPCNMGLFSTLR